MSGLANWFDKSWHKAVRDTLLGRIPPNEERIDVKVTADIPPVAQYGSYALYPGINVTIDPAPGKAISRIAAEEWLYDQDHYYQTNVVTGNLETSTGATLAQFSMININVRDDGFSFEFPKDRRHTAGMPYAQLATFIEITKGVPIITVDTQRLESVVRSELEQQRRNES